MNIMDKKDMLYNKVMMLVAVMLPVCLCFAVPTETMAKKPKKLVILHTNPFHHSARQRALARYDEGGTWRLCETCGYDQRRA